MAYAQRLAGLIREHPDFEIAAPTPFSLICFRYRGSDDENRALLEAVNASGKAFLSHTVLNGRFVLRLAIGNIATQWEDLEETWNLVRQSAKNSVLK
jgi:aromatic-L-amino-acid decarboxylase